jgi:CubicO group peptidase (beta-lactamase class C family)
MALVESALLAVSVLLATPVAHPCAAQPSAAVLADESPVSQAELQSIATKSLERHELPAFALAIVTKDGVETIAVAGIRSRIDPTPLEAGDRMHLGSCTKAFTATLAAALVADGTLRWDSTIQEVLGSDAPVIAEGWRAVTLEDLLRHRGGASSYPLDTDWKAAFDCTAAPEACRKAFVDSMLSRAPSQQRGKHVYSNQGYALAGRMCEVAARKPYEALLRERVLEPLGIASAAFGPPSRTDAASPKGHADSGMVRDEDNPMAIAPAGLLAMSLPDWAKFVAFHLGATPPEALKGAASQLAKLHEAGPTHPKEGLGWITAKRDWGGSVLTHSGSNTMWYATAWLAPERGFAVLSATNQGGERAGRACDEACAFAIKARNAATAKAESAATTPSANPTAPAPADAK